MSDHEDEQDKKALQTFLRLPAVILVGLLLLVVVFFLFLH